MYNNNSTALAGRSAFSDGDLATTTPARVLVKCFDRLDADLENALVALGDDDHEVTNKVLGHAQDLLGEVAGMVDTTVWEHAGSLLAIYDYVLRLLAVANIEKNPRPVREAQRLLTEVGDGFRAAAQEIDRRPQAAPAARPAFDSATATPTAPDGAAQAAPRSGFSVLA